MEKERVTKMLTEACHCVVNILTLRMIDVTKQRSFLILMLLWAFMLKAPHVPRLFEANIC